ncbi:MAG: hypothetical protein VKS61_01960 [Candidatus Sericytochromatia bacterium]|nr:hypothetical protein [Candidatus Sericytochromatia bacterium]
MTATPRPPLVLLGLLASALLGCTEQPSALKTLPVWVAGKGQPPLTASEQASDPAHRAVVRNGAEVCAAVAAAWKAARPQVEGIRAARTRRAPASYSLLAAEGWRFFAGGWSHGSDAGRSIRLTLDNAKGEPVTWDVSDDASYSSADQTTFPAEASRLRLDLGERLPGEGRLQVNLVFPLAAQDQGAIVAGRGDLAQVGTLGPVVVEGLEAEALPNGELARGELSLRTSVDGTTLQLAATFGPQGMTEGRLTRQGKALGRVLPGLPGPWVLATDAGTFSL